MTDPSEHRKLSKFVLLPFQEAGVATLTSMPAVLLADDMGLGKTVQAIVAINRLNAAGEAGRVLVVAPAGLLAYWRQSLQRFAPHLTAIRVTGPVSDRAWQWRSDHTVHIAGYETVRNDAHATRVRAWDVVVLDEAQRIKNRDAGVSRACKLLPRRRSWALTGTPLKNRVDDLTSVLEFVRPNPDGARLPSLSAGISLTMRHYEVQLRRRKQEVLTDLPPRLDVHIDIELTPAQRTVYQRVLTAGRSEIADLGDKATVINVFEVLTRLKQVCNFDPDTGESSKLGDVAGRLEELTAEGHRALVFSQFTSDRFGVERIAAGLSDFKPLTYTGALGLEERDRVIERFRRDDRHAALVLSLRAGGQGLNLQEASYVFHFDRWWNPAVENQASDRAHRMGQKNAVTVYAYTTTGTIEERIEKILAEKRELFANLVDRVSLDPTRHLTPEQVFGLLDLKAPERLASARTAQSGDPVAALARLLRLEGWAVIQAQGPRSKEPVLRAHRLDEIGIESELWAFAPETPTRARLADIYRSVPSGVFPLVLSDEQVDPETREALPALRVVTTSSIEGGTWQ